MKEAVTDAQQRPGFPLRSEPRSLRSLYDGNENRGWLFTLTRSRIARPSGCRLCRFAFARSIRGDRPRPADGTLSTAPFRGV